MKKLLLSFMSLFLFNCDAKLNPSCVKYVAERLADRTVRAAFLTGARMLYEQKLQPNDAFNPHGHLLYNLLFTCDDVALRDGFVSLCGVGRSARSDVSLLSDMVNCAFDSQHKVISCYEAEKMFPGIFDCIKRSVAYEIAHGQPNITLSLLMAFFCEVTYLPIYTEMFISGLRKGMASIDSMYFEEESLYESRNRYSVDFIARDSDEEAFLTAEVRELIALPYYGTPVGYGRSHYVSDDSYVGTRTFPDCVENSTCILFSVLMLNKKPDGSYFFDVDKISQKITAAKRDKFVSFFENIQSIDKIWDGSVEVKSAWNRVVYDLNRVTATDGPNVEYKRMTDGHVKSDEQWGKVSDGYFNEIKAGFHNHIRALSKLLDLPAPTKILSKDIALEYERILSYANSEKVITAKLFDPCSTTLNDSYVDFGGNLLIRIKNVTGTFSASLLLRVVEAVNHTEIVDVTLY
ncbi:MAG: hypothetical protein LBB21_04120 [Holosporaceae bacterium]|nr:hypothetical protein [Holosporaceae bacterium]